MSSNQKQLTLFAEPAATHSQGAAPKGRWLQENAALMEAAAGAPALLSLVRKAARKSAKFRADRSHGHHFEAALADLVNANQADLCAGVLVNAQAVRPDAVGVRITPTAGLADQVWEWEFTGGRTAAMAVNVKALQPGWGSTELASVRNLLAAVTDPDLNLFNPRPTGNPSEMVLRLAAGELELLPGRDYFALACVIDSGGKVEGVEAIGVLSRMGTTAGRLCVRRHSSKEVAQLVRAGAVIPPDFLIAQELAWELSAQNRGGDLRESVWEILGQGLSSQARGELAGELLAVTPQVLARHALAGVRAAQSPGC